nr:MAG TPA: hypothetical protein [Caudoviricetes sp.]
MTFFSFFCKSPAEECSSAGLSARRRSLLSIQRLNGDHGYGIIDFGENFLIFSNRRTALSTRILQAGENGKTPAGQAFSGCLLYFFRFSLVNPLSTSFPCTE